MRLSKMTDRQLNREILKKSFKFKLRKIANKVKRAKAPGQLANIADELELETFDLAVALNGYTKACRLKGKSERFAEYTVKGLNEVYKSPHINKDIKNVWVEMWVANYLYNSPHGEL